MKKIALALASTLVTAPAFAGPYVNVESNASYSGSNYKQRTTDFHVGWEGGNDTFGYYIQGGPSVVALDAVDSDTQVSGKVGADVNATDQLSFYGEVSVLTVDGDADNEWSTKIGTKYRF